MPAGGRLPGRGARGLRSRREGLFRHQEAASSLKVPTRQGRGTGRHRTQAHPVDAGEMRRSPGSVVGIADIRGSGGACGVVIPPGEAPGGARTAGFSGEPRDRTRHRPGETEGALEKARRPSRVRRGTKEGRATTGREKRTDVGTRDTCRGTRAVGAAYPGPSSVRGRLSAPEAQQPSTTE